MTPHDIRVTPRAISARSRRPAAEANDTREVRGMLRVLEQLGYDLDALLATAGLQREDVENPEMVISPSACAAVFAADPRLSDRQLHLGRVGPRTTRQVSPPRQSSHSTRHSRRLRSRSRGRGAR